MFLKKKLRLMTTGKRIAVFSSITALAGTLIITGALKDKAPPQENGETALMQDFLENAMQGKKAVSIALPIFDIPVELIYPGTNVDIIEKSKYGRTGLVENVTVLSISIIDEASVKVTLALTDEQSIKINTFMPEQLSLMVRGNEKEDDKEIEIIEL